MGLCNDHECACELHRVLEPSPRAPAQGSYWWISSGRAGTWRTLAKSWLLQCVCAEGAGTLFTSQLKSPREGQQICRWQLSSGNTSTHAYIREAVQLHGTGWGNCSLHHMWNVRQVFLEPDSHNCTWQTCAPVISTLSHRSGNSPNPFWELPALHCSNSKHAVFPSTCDILDKDGMLKWIYEAHIG